MDSVVLESFVVHSYSSILLIVVRPNFRDMSVVHNSVVH